MSSSGNGADIGQVLTIVQDLAVGQREVRATLQEHSRMLEGHGRMLESHGRILESHGRMLEQHSRKLEDLSADMSGMRQQLTEYHASVLGHGVLISELDQRVRRIERHLNLPPAAE